MILLRVASVLVLVLSLTAEGPAQQRWFETARLLPEPGQPDQQFGAALALSGSTALVGAPTAWGPIGGSFGAGSAYVFVLQGTDWVEQAELDTPALFSPANFGAAVALDDDTAAVGLPLLDVGGSPAQGGVAVFVRDAGAWTLEAYLVAPDVQASPLDFGTALAVHGDTLAVGAPGAVENALTGAGAVYVFVRTAGVWSQQARLVSPSPQLDAAFGSDLDVEDDTLLVGEPLTTPQPSLTSSGAARVYARSGTTWSSEATLLSIDVAAWDAAGVVALSGDRAVLGSPGFLGPGELTTFVRQGGNWVIDALLFDLVYNGKGRAVDIDGDTVVTGTTAFIAAGQRPGVVPYVDQPGGWWQDPVAWGRDGNSGNDSFLQTPILALDGDLLLVGSPLHDGAAEDAGVVHVFTRDGPWADLGQDLEGTSYLPPLMYAAGSLASPSDNELLLAGLPGGGDAYLLASPVDLSVPFLGGVLVPAPDLIVGPVALPDVIGEATTLRFDLPAGIAPGTTVFLQYWFADAGAPQGFAASNALSATVP